MWTPHFLVQKNSIDFSKFMMCPHGQEGRRVEPVLTFSAQREASVFMDGS